MVYIRATGVHLPPAVDVDDAIRRGWTEEATRSRDRLESVTVSPRLAAPEMAVLAARAAYAESPDDADRTTMVFHATLGHQGAEIWPSALHVAGSVVAQPCPGVEVKALSNSGMLALQLATAYLRGGASRDPASVLVTAADRYCAPFFDRWHCEGGMVFGDGGAALVLGAEPGFARVLGVETTGDGRLEGMYRGPHGLTEVPAADEWPIDIDARSRGYLGTADRAEVAGRIRAGQRGTIERVLGSTGVAVEDVDWHVLPHLGWPRLAGGFLRPLGIRPERTTWDLARRVGHLGGADQLAGLHHLRTTGRLSSGELVMLHGVGGGFTWTTAVLEIC